MRIGPDLTVVIWDTWGNRVSTPRRGNRLIKLLISWGRRNIECRIEILISHSDPLSHKEKGQQHQQRNQCNCRFGLSRTRTRHWVTMTDVGIFSGLQFLFVVIVTVVMWMLFVHAQTNKFTLTLD